MTRPREVLDAINETGQRLGLDEALFLEADRMLREILKLRKKKLAIKTELLQRYKIVADKVAFPIQYRHAKTLAADMWSLYTVAMRFRSQKELVARAGAFEFMGMTLVSPERKMGHVAKVYNNGTFRFESFDGSHRQQVSNFSGFTTAI